MPDTVLDPTILTPTAFAHYLASFDLDAVVGTLGDGRSAGARYWDDPLERWARLTLRASAVSIGFYLIANRDDGSSLTSTAPHWMREFSRRCWRLRPVGLSVFDDVRVTAVESIVILNAVMRDLGVA